MNQVGEFADHSEQQVLGLDGRTPELARLKMTRRALSVYRSNIAVLYQRVVCISRSARGREHHTRAAKAKHGWPDLA